MPSRSPSLSTKSLDELLSSGNPWVILLEVTDGPLPTLLTDPGAKLPWHSKIRRQADRIYDEVRHDSRVRKAQVMRARDALQVILKANQSQ